MPRYFGGSVVGASAGIFGVVAAVAALAPDQGITLLLFYVIPVNMRAKILLYASLLYCRVWALSSRNPNFSARNIAGTPPNLGGILFTGMALIKFSGRRCPNACGIPSHRNGANAN